MKALKILCFAITLFAAQPLAAQVVINLNPPAWGPVGYTNVRYYYLPDVQAYYDNANGNFIYYGNGVWMRSSALPLQYRSYDLYRGYKVVMTDYHGESPFIYYPQYKVKYKKGYSAGPQKTIGVRPAPAYKQSNGNSRPYSKPNNGVSKPAQGNGNNSGNGNKSSQGRSNGNRGGNNGGGKK